MHNLQPQIRIGAVILRRAERERFYRWADALKAASGSQAIAINNIWGAVSCRKRAAVSRIWASAERFSSRSCFASREPLHCGPELRGSGLWAGSQQHPASRTLPQRTAFVLPVRA